VTLEQRSIRSTTSAAGFDRYVRVIVFSFVVIVFLYLSV
jgi:hypothetical protein